VLNWCNGETEALIFDAKSFLRAAKEPNEAFDLVSLIKLPSELERN